MSKKLLVEDPSSSDPNFKFGKGMDGKAVYYDALPFKDKAESPWHIAEWHTDQTMDPASVSLNDPTASDAILGKATYSWKTDNGNIAFSAYKSGSNYAYRLSSYNGKMFADGSQNLFLESSASVFTGLDKQTHFSAIEALTSVQKGSSAQQVMNSFVLTFNHPQSQNYNPLLPIHNVFLQVELSDSRGAPSSYKLYGKDTSVYNLAGVDYLPYKASGNSYQVNIDIGAACQKFVSDYKNEFNKNVVSEFSNLSRWSLNSVYIGLETMDGGGAALDVAQVRVETDDTLVSDITNNKLVSIKQVDANFGINSNAFVSFTTDSSKEGVAALTKLDKGPGVPDFLDWQYIWSGAEGVNIMSGVPNTFLHGGAGNDALTATSGKNVLDGGAGSNFLTGGTDANIFFTDARSSNEVWTTINNFGKLDEATLWGFVKGASQYWWDTNVAGANNFKGATLRASISGTSTQKNIDASLTFAGVTVDEAKRFNVTFGSADAGNYLHISR